MLPTSHSRNATASSISSFGSGGGLTLSSAAISPTRAIIARQSSTPRRTSASTVSSAAISSARCASSAMRSRWMWMKLSRDAPSAGGAQPFEAGEPARRVARHREDRMHDQAHLDAALRQLAHDRVEQERHVVVDDLDHRDVAQKLAGAGGRRDPQLRRARGRAPRGSSRRIRPAPRSRARHSGRGPPAPRGRTGRRRSPREPRGFGRQQRLRRGDEQGRGVLLVGSNGMLHDVVPDGSRRSRCTCRSIGRWPLYDRGVFIIHAAASRASGRILEGPTHG